MPDLLADFVPHMVKSRTFADYIHDIKGITGLDIRDRLLDLALENQVNFFDLGCGYGFASLDFFSQLEDRRSERKLPKYILDRIVYNGLDRFTTLPDSSHPNIRFYPETDIRSLKNIPVKISFGVSFFVIPYIDRKLETLANWTSSLEENGEIIITHFYPHQVKAISTTVQKWETCYWDSGINVNPEEFFKGYLYRKNPQVFRLENEHQTLPPFLLSMDEPTLWVNGTPKGPYAGQKKAYYQI